MGIYFQGEEQSLQDILKAREIRQQRQRYLLNNFGNTLVSFKLNIPGPVKYNPLIKSIFDEGIKEFKIAIKNNQAKIIVEEVSYTNSGPEYFAILEKEAKALKSITIEIEDKHPLGRVYDFDVWEGLEHQLSREEMGMSPRECLLCHQNAFFCSRSRNHSVKELIYKIEDMALEYFNSIKNN
ncbi:holo-ACP synthase [Clostridium amylolyticum]|uniref:citrate lyase holo-[acyl-carrier protein] synthase n=1 Tax=Clostridium amylolyticum TaxID=1121298 RepID=A0A1M6LY29_9CLOT|nr:citrate lyase holo-[acyl-carrier protein] synthase [Clostridium amylolyticum]SHJ76118.1 holo-ACP synthase [Clostridium amylolyticum]